MSVASVIVGLLLAVAVAVELLCCIGLVAARDVFDRLHFVGPAATLAPIVAGLAVFARHSSLQSCIKTVLIVLALLMISPVLTHATARAAHVRASAHLADPSESAKEGT